MKKNIFLPFLFLNFLINYSYPLPITAPQFSSLGDNCPLHIVNDLTIPIAIITAPTEDDMYYALIAHQENIILPSFNYQDVTIHEKILGPYKTHLSL